MKPTNLPNQNCESKSSNCIIWDGDKIPCINLCPGDSITYPIYIIATRLCELESQFKLSNYTLTQMEIEFGPVTDFKDMINKLITKAFPTP